MGSIPARLSPYLHLARIASAFAAVGNIWFIILWSRAVPAERESAPATLRDEPLVLLLVGGALTAIGLYTFAMALNDTIDIRRDRMLHPSRPLASGRLGVDAAVWVMAVALVVAVIGSSVLGVDAVRACIIIATGIVAYNAAVKRSVSAGLIVLGLIYAGLMLIPNTGVRFLWPVWVAMTHMVAVGAIAHAVGARRPRLNPAAWGAVGAGWALCTGAIAWLAVSRTGALWPAWVPARTAGVIAGLAAVFAVFIWLRCRMAHSPDRAAGRAHRYGSLWLVLYAAGWLFSQELIREGVIAVALAAVGLLGMTLIREIYNLIDNPVDYRA